MVTSATTQAAVQRLLDLEAIRALPQRYCHCVWQEDWDGYAGIFTEDGVFANKSTGAVTARGHAELRDMISRGMESSRLRPFIHNHVVELLGEKRAKGTCYVEVRMVRQGVDWLLVGWYEDEYAKVDGEWKISSRTVIVDSSGPAHGPGSMAGAAE